MDASLLAYRILVELARVDGEVSPEERRLLERYRIALGLERESAGLAELEPHVDAAAIGTITREQGIHVLGMMIRVAHADGVLAERERQRLQAVADRLGVGPVKYAEMLVRSEAEIRGARKARGSHRKIFAALGILLLVGAAVAYFVVRRGATTAETGQLRTRMDRLTLEQAARDEELVRRSHEGSVGIADFKQVESAFGASVVLVVVAYDLIKDGYGVTQWSSGTGFFVSPDGLIVTNKHVAEPWKFSADVARQIDAGFRIDPASLRIAAWPAGAHLIDEQGDFDVASGYYNGNGTLQLLRTTEDRFEVRRAVLADGSSYTANLHEVGLGDLAVLKAELAEPVRPFALPAALPGVEKLDPIMVLGFPRGIAILEGENAELSAALGQVSKIENSIMITAPVVPGNSGGPVIDRQGHVVGVATLTPGQGLGICIQARDFLGLLPTAGELIGSAADRVDRGRDDEAAAFLDLAELRDPSPAERTELEALRGRAGER